MQTQSQTPGTHNRNPPRLKPSFRGLRHIHDRRWPAADKHALLFRPDCKTMVAMRVEKMKRKNMMRVMMVVIVVRMVATMVLFLLLLLYRDDPQTSAQSLWNTE